MRGIRWRPNSNVTLADSSTKNPPVRPLPVQSSKGIYTRATLSEVVRRRLAPQRLELVSPFVGSLLVDEQFELVSALALDLEVDVAEEVDDGDDD